MWKVAIGALVGLAVAGLFTSWRSPPTSDRPAVQGGDPGAALQEARDELSAAARALRSERLRRDVSLVVAAPPPGPLAPAVEDQAPVATPEQERALVSMREVVERARRSGEWAAGDREAWRELAPSLPPGAMAEVMREIIKETNGRRIRVLARPLF